MKITTLEQLEAHIEAHKGRDVPLFTAYGKHGFITNDTLKSHQKIEIKDTGEIENLFIYLDECPMHSLMDRHLTGEQNYNDNWWFTTEEAALAYVHSKEIKHD